MLKSDSESSNIAPVKPKPVNDDELRLKVFAVDNPEALSSLVQELPHTDNPEIEYAYDVTPPKSVKRDRVWCAHCEKHSHWRGYVLRTETGARYLVGKDCGLEHYGANFRLIEREFDSLRKRKHYLERLDEARAAWPAASDELNALSASKAFGQMNAMRNGLRRYFPELYPKLEEAAKRGGVLIVRRRVRDIAAEERASDAHDVVSRLLEQMTVTERKNRRKAGTLPNVPDLNKQIFITVEDEFGRLEGAEFLLAHLGLRDDASAIVRRLQLRFAKMLGEATENISTGQLQAFFRSTKADLEELEAVHREIQAPRRFFAPTNLRRISEWAKRRADISSEFAADGSQLVRLDDETQVGFKSGYAAPGIEACLELWKIASGER